MNAAMHRLDVDVIVDDPRWVDAVDETLEDTLPTVVMAAIAGGGPPAGPAALSLLLADDARLKDLNGRYRGKDAPTNVLSFALAADDTDGPGPVPGEPIALGDVAIAYETVVEEARTEGKSLRDHLYHLVVHGTLHLLGHDHIDDTGTAAMERLEAGILATLGIADPYAVPADTAADRLAPLSPEAS